LNHKNCFAPESRASMRRHKRPSG